MWVCVCMRMRLCMCVSLYVSEVCVSVCLYGACMFQKLKPVS